MKNLTLCAAWELEPDPEKELKNGSLIVFVESWKKYMSNNTEMIMIVDPNSTDKKIKYLEDSNITVKYFSSASFIPTSIHNSRYFQYLDILLELREKYDRVFHCDTRDVAFQGNVFEEIKAKSKEEDLFVNEEDSKFNLSEPFNQKMLIANYGIEIADELSSNRILCSGTTLGSCQMMINYIKILISTRSMLKFQAMGRVISQCGEQGPYNYIFHKNLINHTKLENGVGVATLGLTHSNDVNILEDGRLSVYGKMPSVIHQWNRFYCKKPLLTEHYSNLYNKNYV